MELKLFGKSIFEFRKGYGDLLFTSGSQSQKKQKFLIDFYEFQQSTPMGQYIATVDENGTLVAVESKNLKKKKVAKKNEPINVTITPKGVYELNMLNYEGFKIKTDPVYIDEQLATFKEKLSMIKSADYDMSRGVKEIGSIIERLENRKRYPEFNEFYEQYAYTTTEKINELVKVHSHLRLGKVDQFLADMPKEATDTMKDYTKNTESLCQKKPLFYILAEKKDFEKSDRRRDPILFAQSPFGHVWQILGAWDKEMLLLDEL